MSPFKGTQFPKTLNEAALLFVIACTAACTLTIPGSGMGTPCFGYGCADEPSPPVPQIKDRLVASVRFSTLFDRSVRPSIDNFLSRYQSAPDNPELKRWIDDFFQPAKRLLGKEFDFEPIIKVVVIPQQSSLTAQVIQEDWHEVSRGDPSFAHFLPLVSPPNADGQDLTWKARGKPPVKVHVASVRWRVFATTKITPVSAKKVRYATTLELQVGATLSDNQGHSFMVQPADETPPFRFLADRLFESLYSEYVAFLRNEYDLEVTKLTREK
jgi:hypothetical protein